MMIATYGKLTSEPGKIDELIDIMKQAAKLVANEKGCHMYIVNASRDEEDVLWITELWDTQEGHDASLKSDEVKAIIAQALPLISKPPEQISLTPLVGKGMPGDAVTAPVPVPIAETK
jgi:quinol monooxygenase YgiN